MKKFIITFYRDRFGVLYHAITSRTPAFPKDFIETEKSFLDALYKDGFERIYEVPKLVGAKTQVSFTCENQKKNPFLWDDDFFVYG